MPPVHTQHKENMLCQTKGVSICSIPLDAPYMLGCPLYVWLPLMFGWPPVCLDTPHMFGCPHMFRNAPCLDTSLYVWTPHMFRCPLCLDTSHVFGCPLYIYDTKKACFVRLRGCPYAPMHLDALICLDAPCMFRCPYIFGCSPCMFGCCHMFGWPHLYVWMLPYVWTPPMFGCPICLDTPHVWMPPICSDTPICLDSPMFGCPLYLDTALYNWMPAIWLAVSLYVWMPHKCMGHPKVWGTSKHRGGIQMYGGHPYIWGHMDTPSVWQSMLSFCCVCRVSIQTSSKHTGGHPNIQEGVQTYGGVLTYGGIQTYRWASKLMGGIQTYGASKCMEVYRHLRSLTKYAFFVLCMYRGHPNGKYQNMQEASKHMGAFKHTGGHPDIQGVSKHMGASKYKGPSKHMRGIQTYRGCFQRYGGIQTYRELSKHMEASKHTGGIQTYRECTNVLGA